MFAICDNQAILVADALLQNSLQVRFRRSLDQEGLRQWSALLELMAPVFSQNWPRQGLLALGANGSLFGEVHVYQTFSGHDGSSF
jgi:hypothetical protein